MAVPDIPIILGISPFKNRYDLLLEKAGLKEDTFEGNIYTEYGNTLEPLIRNYVNELYKTNYIEDKYIENDIRCHYDGIDEKSILEIKTTSKIYDDVNEYKVYLSQLLFYMQYAKKDKGVIAVYNRPKDFNEVFDSNRLNLYEININNYQDLLNEINEAVNKFREDLEKVKSNPFITEEELLPDIVEENAKQLLAIEEELKFYDEMVKRRDELKERIRNAMLENNLKSIPIGNLKITNVLDGEDKEVQKFNEKQFKEENEELYNKYLETKIQKGRKGFLLIKKGDE